MKALGKSSISSVLKKVITIAFYVEFLLILTLPLVFLDDDGIRYSWPVTLTTVESKPIASSTTGKISEFVFQERYNVSEKTTKKMLSFEDSSLGRRLLQTLHNVVTIAAILMITFWLKQLFSKLAEDKPFIIKNANRVRWIAWTVLAVVLFDILRTFLYGVYTMSTISLSGAEFDRNNYSFDLRAFLIGLILLIVAELFKRGHEYQTDVESIL